MHGLISGMSSSLAWPTLGRGCPTEQGTPGKGAGAGAGIQSGYSSHREFIPQCKDMGRGGVSCSVPPYIIKRVMSGSLGQLSGLRSERPVLIRTR